MNKKEKTETTVTSPWTTVVKLSFYMFFFLNLVAALLIYVASPEKVAAHFDVRGAADGWMTRESQLLIMLGMNVFVFATFLGCIWLSYKFPSLINVPNPAYWKREENLPEMRRRLLPFLYEIGVLCFAFLAATELLAFHTNRLDPPRMGGGMYLLFGLLGLGFAVWFVRTLRQFRVPEEETGAGVSGGVKGF